MKNPLLIRVATIACLAMLLLGPLGAISGKIEERQATRASVLRDLAASGVGPQQLAGPVVIQPCTEHFVEDTIDVAGRHREEKRTSDCSQIYVADELSISGPMTVVDRHRGIYAARFYSAALEVKGEFSFRATGDRSDSSRTRIWGQPILQLLISDVRGVGNRMTLNWSGQSSDFLPGLTAGASGTGVHAAVDVDGKPIEGKRSFSFKLDLSGMEQLSFLPSAGRTTVAIRAPWPHPSFFGHHLPDDRNVLGDSFDASWHVSGLASDAPEVLRRCVRSKCENLGEKSFGVALIDPVNVYLQSSRAVNYGFLFVGLTFTAFFATEVLRRLAIHPAQYLLVGLALTVFYLLLFSMSEHIAFGYAYAIASVACISLLTFYTAFVLRSIARALAFGGMLILLYGALYVLLQSQDYALLMGALLVFGLLSGVMVLTRRLDWHDVARTLGEGRTVKEGS